MKRAMLDELLAARAHKRAVALITDVRTGRQQLVDPRAPAPGVAAELVDAARQALTADRGRTFEHDGARLFVQAHNPRLRMLIVGAVHITQALAPMAAMAGYAVVVIDPRRAFATPERLPGLEVSTEWPDDAFERLGLDARTAVVTLTHDPKIDDPALRVALASDAFYIGSLGSRRTHASRCERLAGAGFDEAARARIHGPIGLDIGARSPAEIAVSILGEVTARLRRPASGPASE